MIRRPPRSTHCISSAASDVYKRQNPGFWIKKIERNRNRDYENDKKLLFLGYTVLHFWGQDISKHTDECLQAIEETIWDTKFSDTATDYDIPEE